MEFLRFCEEVLRHSSEAILGPGSRIATKLNGINAGAFNLGLGLSDTHLSLAVRSTTS